MQRVPNRAFALRGELHALGAGVCARASDIGRGLSERDSTQLGAYAYIHASISSYQLYI